MHGEDPVGMARRAYVQDDEVFLGGSQLFPELPGDVQGREDTETPDLEGGLQAVEDPREILRNFSPVDEVPHEYHSAPTGPRDRWICARSVPLGWRPTDLPASFPPRKNRRVGIPCTPN